MRKMIHKLSLIKNPEKFPYIEELGTINSLPTPFSSCTEHDFIHALKIYSPLYFEYRQVHIEGKFCASTHIYWFPTCAYAVVLPDKWRCGKEGESRIVYMEPSLYYRIGCIHNWNELTQSTCQEKGIVHHGMHWHVEKCSKCGMSRSYDSSG